MHFRQTSTYLPISANSEYRSGATLRYDVFVGDSKKGTLSIDLVVGEVFSGTPETINPKHRLDIAGLVERPYAICSIEDTVADKVGATLQTYNAGKLSTRVRDLVDLTVIIHLQAINGTLLSGAIERERKMRKIAPLSSFSVPEMWLEKYAHTYSHLAIEAKLPVSLQEIIAAELFVAECLNPVIRGEAYGFTWEPSTRKWMSHETPRVTDS